LSQLDATLVDAFDSQIH